MKLTNIALTIVLAAVTAFAVGKYVAPAGSGGAAHKESAYERVMRTGTLRCAYAQLPYFFEKDVNTGKFSGYYYTITEEIGKRLNLKIEWTEEVGLANAFEGLKTNRYDIVPLPFSPTPSRARVVEFTDPILFLPYYAFVRTGDTRFDNNLKAINDPSIKVAVLEGELSQIVKNEDFPKAGMISIPNLADNSQVFIQVTTGKADMFFAEPSSAESYSLGNPGKIRRVVGPPLRMQAPGIVVGVGEEALKSLLNTTIASLHSTGFIERLFIKSEKDKDFYFLPSQPWRRAGD